MAHPVDAVSLRQRIQSGAGVRAIAVDLRVTERTVRNRLRRAGIPLPSTPQGAHVDMEMLFADYRAGASVARLSARDHVGETWIRRRIAEHGVERNQPMRRASPAPRYVRRGCKPSIVSG